MTNPADPQDIRRRAAEAVRFQEQTAAGIARLRPDVFQQFVIRDEATGGPIVLSSTHRAWHKLATEHDRLAIWAHIEAGKSVSLSIARALWEIGNDPTLRVAILSNTHAQATKLVRAVARHVTTNERVKRVFPDLKPDEPWTDSAFTVVRRTASKDPTVQAIGVHGSILGARIDLLIVDDILDFENCRTPDARQKLFEWMQSTVMGRLTSRGRVIVVGTAFHPDDLLHRLAMTPGWKAVRYPVIDSEGTPRWPERWSKERIEKKRLELGPLEFARQMLCVARDDSEARFKKEWIDLCLDRGKSKTMAYALESVPVGCRVYTGVDLAVQQHASSDYTVLVTALFAPNGDRELLDIQRGKWAGPDIVKRIVETHRRYQGIIIVENNSAQTYLEQYTRQQGIPVKGFTTGRNKAHPEFGVESLAAELAGGQWIFPCARGHTKELDVLIAELLHYDPAAHTGDTVMAMWLCREGSRMVAPKAEMGRLNLLAR